LKKTTVWLGLLSNAFTSIHFNSKENSVNKSTRMFCIGALCSAMLVTTMTSCARKDDPISIAAAANKEAGIERLSIVETKAIAEKAFVYGLPIVMNYAVMNEFVVDKTSPQYKAPFNTIKNEARVFTYKDTAVVTPNSDTPYSMLWLDLRTEPMVISVPAVPRERYYSVQLTDGNAYNYGYIGTRATGIEAGDYLIVGPGWTGNKPSNIKEVFASTTPFALSIFRTQLFDADDMPNVVKIQEGYKAQPLSSFLGQPAPPAAPEIDFLPATTEGIKENFYEYLNAALEFVPVTPQNKEIRDEIGKIGIGAGKNFELKDLSLIHKVAVLLAMKGGNEAQEDFLESGMQDVDGWKIGSIFGDGTFYKQNWVMRAAAAKAGIYGNDAIEAMYPMTRSDENGKPLDGSKNSYSLTFPTGELPPVNAFWSITMYDGSTQLLVKNPINRYLVNSPMLSNMSKHADGSLTLYIQKDSPGKDKEANWLPAPDGPIYLIMRLYWPKTEEPSILPPGLGSWHPPGVVQIN
jgi:hypothetical protein